MRQFFLLLVFLIVIAVLAPILFIADILFGAVRYGEIELESECSVDVVNTATYRGTVFINNSVIVRASLVDGSVNFSVEYNANNTAPTFVAEPAGDVYLNDTMYHVIGETTLPVLPGNYMIRIVLYSTEPQTEFLIKPNCVVERGNSTSEWIYRFTIVKGTCASIFVCDGECITYAKCAEDNNITIDVEPGNIEVTSSQLLRSHILSEYDTAIASFAKLAFYVSSVITIVGILAYVRKR